jgi:excisionase family DNA binding protein
MQHQGRRDGTPPEQQPTPEDDGRLTWTVREAARLLGISTGSAYEAAHRGELRSSRTASARNSGG